MDPNKEKLEKFVDPKEELILVQREHWFVLLVPFFFTFFISVILFYISFFIFINLYQSFLTLILIFSLIFSSILSTVLKIFVDWYFHLHVLTNNKILEIRYSPLFKDEVCEVLLDQVRCTEVDVTMKGAIREFLNIGDVNITFDRPTHQEEFIFANIKNPGMVAEFLSKSFNSGFGGNYNEFWIKTREKPEKLIFTEEIPK